MTISTPARTPAQRQDPSSPTAGPSTVDVVNVRPVPGTEPPSPVPLRNGVEWPCGVDERGAAGALPGAATGRRCTL